MGLIWLEHPVLWHSDRTPAGYNYSAMTAEQIILIRTPWLDWYTDDWYYGYATVSFLCAGIFIAILTNLLFKLRAMKVSADKPALGSNVINRLTATCRAANVYQFKLERIEWYSPSLSAIIAVACMFIFTMALILAVRPYYWPNMEMGHSMPIATRSGWIAMGFMPFMIAFSTKVNFISFLGGTSHEKLQVFHRWTATFMYIASLVHTFPFIVKNINMGVMVDDWNTSPWYWSGVAALVPQTWLIFMSWGFIRNPYYETFKKLHFIAAAIFMPALFIHCNFRLTSWDYFWATSVIYGLTWFFRHGRTHWNSGLGLKATATRLPDQMVRVVVLAPPRFKWKAGQHVFIRFLDFGIHAFSSHPFTIASLCDVVQEELTLPEGAKAGRVVEFVFRAHKGMTGALAKSLVHSKVRSMRVLLDGPYGGLATPLKNFDRVLFLAGGSGATFILPLLKDLLRDLDVHGTRTKTVDFILAVRHYEALEWMEEDGSLVNTLMKETRLATEIYVTRKPAEAKDNVDNDFKLKPEADDFYHTGRPDLSTIIRKVFHSTNGKLGVVACGPESFLFDAGNAIASCQILLVRGLATPAEVFLHTENYSW